MIRRAPIAIGRAPPHRGFIAERAILAIHGYNRTRKRFETAWIDSVHNGTAIMFSAGNAGGEEMAVFGSYADPNGGPDWGWRTEVVMKGPDEMVITAFNITPEGREARGVETSYRRAGSGPA